MKEAIPAIPRYSLMSSLEGYTKIDTGEWVLYSDHLRALAQAEHPNVPSDLAPLWEELEAVARTGGATVAAGTCMGLIKRVWAAEHERDAMRDALRVFRERHISLFVGPHETCDLCDKFRAALAADPGEERK